MSIPTDLTIYQNSLFLSTDDMAEQNIPVYIRERVIRLRSLYSTWLNFPQKNEKELIQLDMEQFRVQQRQAYDDIFIVKYLLGNLQTASKDFHRWKFNNMILHAYKEAERLHDAKSMAAAADKYAKYNKLDKDDELDKGFADIRPQGFEPTDNPKLIGINKSIGDIRRESARLIAEYSNTRAAEVEYAEFEEVEEKEDKRFDFNESEKEQLERILNHGK